MPKDDPLSNEVSEQLNKHTLWLNSENFEEMVQASYAGLSPDLLRSFQNMTGGGVGSRDVWRLMCAAALAVIEWRMTGRVRP